eukprot:5912936-Ditylum_brightwellii.AAC.1
MTKTIEKVNIIATAPKPEQQQMVEKDLDHLYNSFHNSMIKASDSIDPYPVHWWTIQVKQAYQILQYWIAAATFKNCRMLGEAVLSEKRAKLDEGINLYQGKENKSIA